MMEKLSLDKFEEAYERVQEVVLPTNLVQSDFFSQMTGNKVYFKPENLQLTGAYKIRGAYYKISTLSDEEKAKGLITASAGNHCLLYTSGDNAPGEIIKGAIDAINERADIKLRLFGDKDKIEAELHKYTYNKEQIEITHTTEEISCNEAPAIAIKKKKDSSLVVAIKSVKNGECDAIVSAGSSGAILVGGQVLIGKGKGVKRAPLAPLTPTEKGVSLLIDCGANVDARPEHLLQFAQMGSIYMEDVVGVKNPRVAIVNIGAEEAKGNALVKETYPCLLYTSGRDAYPMDSR